MGRDDALTPASLLKLAFGSSNRTASHVGSEEGRRTRKLTEAELQAFPLPPASPLPASISFGQVVEFAKSLMLWKVGKQRKRKWLAVILTADLFSLKMELQ